MTDYQIQPISRQCSLTGRDLRPGEAFFTALLDEGGRFVRKDYSREAWQGPPPGAFSHWMGRVPARDADRRPPIDDGLLLDCLQRLEGQDDPSRISFRYVVALLLMRRKRLRFEDVRTEDEKEWLRLRCPQTRTTYEVLNPALTDDEIQTVQQEVFAVLGWR